MPTSAPAFPGPTAGRDGLQGLWWWGWCSWEFGAPCRALCSTEERGTRSVSKIPLHHWVILCFVFGSSWLWESCVYQPQLLLLILLTCWHSPCEQLGSFRPRDRQQEAEDTESKGGTPSFEDFSAAMAFLGFLKERHLKMRFYATSKSIRVTSKEVKIFLLGMLLINPG